MSSLSMVEENKEYNKRIIISFRGYFCLKSSWVKLELGWAKANQYFVMPLLLKIIARILLFHKRWSKSVIIEAIWWKFWKQVDDEQIKPSLENHFVNVSLTQFCFLLFADMRKDADVQTLSVDIFEYWGSFLSIFSPFLSR